MYVRGTWLAYSLLLIGVCHSHSPSSQRSLCRCSSQWNPNMQGLICCRGFGEKQIVLENHTCHAEGEKKFGSSQKKFRKVCQDFRKNMREMNERNIPYFGRKCGPAPTSDLAKRLWEELRRVQNTPLTLVAYHPSFQPRQAKRRHLPRKRRKGK